MVRPVVRRDAERLGLAMSRFTINAGGNDNSHDLPFRPTKTPQTATSAAFSFANSRVGRHLTRRRVLTETCLRDYTHPRVSDLINLTLDKEIARHD